MSSVYGRKARVSPCAHHHVRLKLRKYLFRLFYGLCQTSGDLDVAQEVFPVKPVYLSEIKAISLFRDERALHTPRATHKTYIRVRVGTAYVAGYRKGGVNVSGGASPGKQYFHLSALSFRLFFGRYVLSSLDCRETDMTMPISNSSITSELPP